MLTGLSRTTELGLKWALGILLFTGLGYVAVRHTLHKTSSDPGECSSQFKKPKNLTVGDFQRSLDREFLAKFMKWDETRAAGWIDGMILLPFYDDVAKRQLSMGAVELTGMQRKDILRLVEECADILDMPVPRVYIQPQDRLNALAGGFVDPVLVLDSRFLSENWNERQLRALIGHELGHLKCRHSKLQALVNIAVAHSPGGIAPLVFFSHLEWSREAEMSADNAGLVCSQDLDACEQLQICLLLNLDPKEARKIDVDAFLAQRSKTKVSWYAEARHLLEEFMGTHPFAADRINQLRDYAASDRYRNLWER